mmetsp:Transcript_9895/g.19000  ORF Transcript_9895/g.19000 Transcript_9895/m.19000 type:complete len:258 (-) Transcript_9895:142-915(-)
MAAHGGGDQGRRLLHIAAVDLLRITGHDARDHVSPASPSCKHETRVIGVIEEEVFPADRFLGLDVRQERLVFHRGDHSPFVLQQQVLQGPLLVTASTQRGGRDNRSRLQEQLRGLQVLALYSVEQRGVPVVVALVNTNLLAVYQPLNQHRVPMLSSIMQHAIPVSVDLRHICLCVDQHERGFALVLPDGEGKRAVPVFRRVVHLRLGFEEFHDDFGMASNRRRNQRCGSLVIRVVDGCLRLQQRLHHLEMTVPSDGE